MAGAIEGLEFLAKPAGHRATPVCVVFGDDAYLRRRVLDLIQGQVLPGEDADFSLIRLDGDRTTARDVLDELHTPAMFGGGPRLVIVEDAEDFISKNRPALEDYVAHPVTSAVLALDTKAWLKTTRLFKALSGALQVDCKAPTPAKLAAFLVSDAKSRHQMTLDRDVAEMLVERLGTELGLLEQELTKLAASVGPKGRADLALAEQLVGGWRARTVWDVIDAAADGEAPLAIDLLERLLASGEHPLAALGPMSSSLRKFAAATRLIEQGEARGSRVNLRQSLEAAGVKDFYGRLNRAEQQLRQLNRRRAGKLYRWLLEADLGLKGESRLPPRVLLERLIARLSNR